MKYDVTIVGGGPAGCMVASNLSSDYRTLILDQSVFPRKKTCGGALLEKSTDFLKQFDVPDNVFAEPRSLNLRYSDWDTGLKIERDRDFWNVYRDRFDEWLFGQIPETVDFSDSTRVLDYGVEDSGLVLTIKYRNNVSRVRTRYLVDASGVYSIVQKKMGRRPPLYVAVQDYFIAEDDSNFLDAFLCDEVTDYYIWVIPKDGFVLAGTAFREGVDVKRKIRVYRSKLQEELGLGNPVESEAGMLLRPMSLDDILLTSNNILLVGEAAGLISSSTGEGISFALRSGDYCARALNKCFEEPYDLYKKYCSALIGEVCDKIERAKIYSNREIRLKFFQKYSIKGGD